MNHQKKPKDEKVPFGERGQEKIKFKHCWILVMDSFQFSNLPYYYPNTLDNHLQFFPTHVQKKKKKSPKTILS